VIATTQKWLSQMVLGLNLCPFSHHVVDHDQVHYAVCNDTTDAQLKQFYVSQLQLLLEARDTQIATSLLMFPNGLDDFDDYLDLLDWFQQLLDQANLAEHLQLASFHPRYQFEGAAKNELSNYTNRAPYPTVHLLRQAHMTKALQQVGDPQKIYEDNIQVLTALGREKVESLCPWSQ
jgi:hypothetical protein